VGFFNLGVVFLQNLMYNTSIESENIMWSDFSDYELAELAGRYGLEDNLVFDYELSLANRDEIEKLLTEFEWEIVNAERSI